MKNLILAASVMFMSVVPANASVLDDLKAVGTASANLTKSVVKAVVVDPVKAAVSATKKVAKSVQTTVSELKK